MRLQPELTISLVRLFLNLSLCGAPIAIGLALAFRITRSGSPRARYLIALAAFFVAAVYPVMQTWRRESVNPPTESVSQVALHAGETSSTGAGDAAPVADRALPTQPALVDWLSPAIEQIASGPVGGGLMILWVGMAVLLLVRETGGHVSNLRARRSWMPAADSVRQALSWAEEIPLLVHEESWPCTVGWVWPAVVLPADLAVSLPPAAARQVARHELSHAIWRDPLVNACVRLLRAILWPSLPLWFLERVIREEREVAADRAALRQEALSPDSDSAVVEYAEALLSIARLCRRRSHPLFSQAGATHIGAAHLEERVRRLFRPSQPLTRTRVTAAGLMMCGGVTSLAFIPMASRGLAPQTLAAQRQLVIQRRIAGFTDSPAARRSTAAMNRLLAELKNRDWRMDTEVRSDLEEIRASGTIEPLTLTLGVDHDWRVREKVAWMLGQLKDRRAVAALIVALSDPASEVKHTAAWALGMIGDPMSAGALIDSLRDQSFEARQGAAWALGNMREPRATTALLPLLDDSYADVRHAAAWALGKIGDRQAAGALQKALNDRDADVRAQAQASMLKLGGQ